MNYNVMDWEHAHNMVGVKELLEMKVTKYQKHVNMFSIKSQMEINVQMIGNAMAWEHALHMDGVKESLVNLRIWHNALVIDS